jgi:energy-coupling factor transport system permease protein
MAIRHELWRELHTFDLVHPGLQLGCVAVILVFTMAAIHPVFLVISFVAALAFSVYSRGFRATLKTLASQIPLIVLCAVINPFFASSGTSELLHIASRAIYLESVIYGACMGIMLASVMLWFYNATKVLTSDKVLAVLGRGIPTVGLMVSMTMRLVPQFVERGKLINDTAQASTAAKPLSKEEKAAARVRLVSVLMGWSMEDSLETADAMRARGWGATRKRTCYQRYRFASFDVMVSITLIVLVIITAIAVAASCLNFQFYPQISGLDVWWGYIPYTVCMSLPLLACLVEDARWRHIS